MIKATCSEIMTKDPVCCFPTDDVQKAADLMKQHDIGPLPVVEDDTVKKLIGIVTDRDLVVNVLAEKLNPSKTRIAEVMTRDPISCHENDSLYEALDKMSSYQVRRIPVVDDNNCIIGIIAQADIATRVENPEVAGEVVKEVSQD
jgi:CBS domain-containing protein